MITHIGLLPLIAARHNSVDELLRLKERCCEQLVNAFLDIEIFIHEDTKIVFVGLRDYITITHCPFCGAKLELVNVN